MNKFIAAAALVLVSVSSVFAEEAPASVVINGEPVAVTDSAKLCLFNDRNGQSYAEACQTVDVRECKFTVYPSPSVDCLAQGYAELSELRSRAKVMDMALNDQAMGEAYVFEANMKALIYDLEHSTSRSTSLIEGAKELQRRFNKVKADISLTYKALEDQPVKGVEYGVSDPQTGFSIGELLNSGLVSQNGLQGLSGLGQFIPQTWHEKSE